MNSGNSFDHSSLLLTLLLLMTLATPKLPAGQDTKVTPSAPIVAVTAAGSKRFSEADVVKASGLEVGKDVTKDDIQAAADRLGALGWFNHVQYKFSTGPKGLKIEFSVEDAPSVPVSFDNFPWFTEQELARAIREAVGLFDGTAPEGGEVVDHMKQALEQLAAAHSLHGSVEVTLLAAPGEGGMVQQFHLAGPVVKVGSVEFSDPLARGDRRISERLSDILGKPYSRYTIEIFEYEQVRPVYLSKGFLRVRFGAPEARFAGDPRQALPDNVVIRLPIEPGKAYLWAGATWTGIAAFDPTTLDRFTGLVPGEPADGNKIQAAWDRVLVEYGRRGYIEAKVEPQAVFDDPAGRMSCRVAITEGVQYRVGQIVITGLSLAAERQLLAAWRLPRGEIFDKQYFDDFLATGVRKIFENSVVHFETVGHLLRTHPDAKLVDVLLDFQ